MLFSATWLAGSLQPLRRSAEMIHPRKGMNKHARLTAQTSILDEARACKGHEAASALPVQETLPPESLKECGSQLLPKMSSEPCGRRTQLSRDSGVAERLHPSSSAVPRLKTHLQHQSRILFRHHVLGTFENTAANSSLHER